ncbi:hypothetical protein GPECTOR_60g744 [Gonium pectorale]|uniref:RRM domain-containing protein n=1 Tax=Gonium pectorale TaxID=33097 RepID=A0A150G505_GONPE|nr:hypothetical protein GPECTOR_60g744 [Gonium pectorale]|eukprot:KXZ44966.1 hypothetical protein GPECTOR_60g744 [Gonium pectorale]
MTDDDKPRSEESPHKVFVGGISYRMDEAGLRELFDKYNPDNVVIQLDKLTQKPRGFGFVTFKDRDSMLDAIRDLHNKDVDGRPISVKEAIPQDQIKPGTPASALTRGGGGGREGGGRYDRGGYDRRYDSRAGGYDRYGGGYDRGGYDRYGGGYGDPRQYDYGRGGGYDRGYGGGGYGGGYERDPYYRDPYARDPYAAPQYGSGYEPRGYDSRYQGAYDSRYPADYPPGDDRYRSGAGGPDRGRYPPGPARAAPYGRPDDRRDVRR